MDQSNLASLDKWATVATRLEAQGDLSTAQKKTSTEAVITLISAYKMQQAAAIVAALKNKQTKPCEGPGYAGSGKKCLGNGSVFTKASFQRFLDEKFGQEEEKNIRCTPCREVYLALVASDKAEKAEAEATRTASTKRSHSAMASLSQGASSSTQPNGEPVQVDALQLGISYENDDSAIEIQGLLEDFMESHPGANQMEVSMQISAEYHANAKKSREEKAKGKGKAEN